MLSAVPILALSLVAAPAYPHIKTAPMVTRSRVSTATSGETPNSQLQEAVVPPAELAAAAPPPASGKILGVPKIVPTLTILAVIGYWITTILGTMSGPIIGGVKLVYAGAIAGIVSRSFCAPLEMVSTVMMCRGDECMSMTDELKKAWKQEGWDGLFKGNTANCLKVAPSRGTQFLVYEFAKRQMRAAGFGLAAAGGLNAGARLCAGGFAGMVAAIIVYPLEVIKTLRTVYPEECTGIVEAGKAAMKYGGGVGGLYAGVLPTLVAMFPYVGVEFMVYETLKTRWAAYFGGQVSVAALLLIGAIAGAAAQASAHPLDVVRRRMQMEGFRQRFAKKSDDASGKKAPAKPPITNLVSGLYSIGKEEGIHCLFKGLGPACFEKVPSTAIGYYIYEAMKTTMRVASV